MRGLPILTLALAAMAGAAEPAGGAGVRLHLPVLRLIDGKPDALPRGHVWGAYVEIAGEQRLTLASLAPGAGAGPPAAAADVLSAPFEVPREASLAFGIGIQRRAPGRYAAEFRVDAAEPAGATTLYRQVFDAQDERAWRDERVDLSAFAGRTIRLRMTTTLRDPAPPGAAFPVWADPVVSAPRDAHAPNVVVVSLDTLRARSVGTHGAERPTTPWLDAFGATGTVFDAAYTTAPHTLPAHLGLFTGRYVRNLGDASPLRPLDAAIPTLTERLREAGYATAAFTEDGFVIPHVGIRRGFSQYRERTSPERGLPLGQAAQTFQDGVAWLARHRDRPAFLFLHTYEVHDPYAPPAPYDAAFERQRGPDTVPEAELLRYEQEVRYLDDEVRAFVESVDALGLGVRTMLVVLSDHGDEFMEHGQTRHCFQLYAETIHVPFMMRLPGVVPAGLRVATPVSLVDVAPTILDVVGAHPIDGVDGVSLLPLLEGRAPPAWRRAVFSEAFSSRWAGRVDLVSARSGDVRCTYDTRHRFAQCYDVLRDPHERTPLPPHAAFWSHARVAAMEYASGLPMGAAANASLLVPPTPPEPARLQKLRELGYVE